MRNTESQLMPPIRESTIQTAARLRRYVRERWATVTFSVRTEGTDIRLSWTGGPSSEQVGHETRSFSRAANGEPTLWASRRGGVALVWPGADRVVLQRNA